MKKLLLLPLAVLAISCNTTTVKGTEMKSSETMATTNTMSKKTEKFVANYISEDNTTKLLVVTEMDMALVRVDGKTISGLERIVSASGATYYKEGVTLTLKGKKAYLEMNNTIIEFSMLPTHLENFAM